MSILPRFEKPVARTSLPDWYSKQWEIRQGVASRIGDTWKVIDDCRLLRNEVNASVEWASYHNNKQLTDRVTELRRFISKLESIADCIKEEIKKLKEEKRRNDEERESYNKIGNFISDCFRVRDNREKEDLCYDGPDAELKKELTIVEKIQTAFATKSANAFEQSVRLENALCKINRDIDAKKECLRVELNTLDITKEKICSSVLDVERMPKGMQDYNTWLEESKANLSSADYELAVSVRMREGMILCRTSFLSDFLAQQDVTNFEFRKRIYEMNRAKTEYERQRDIVLGLVKQIQLESVTTEGNINPKINLIKAVETRIENRNNRPVSELTDDETRNGMLTERRQLYQSIKDITDKLDEVRQAQNKLENLIVQIDFYLDNKNGCLAIENECMEIRKQMFTCCQDNLTRFDRNVKLFRMEEVVPNEE